MNEGVKLSHCFRMSPERSVSACGALVCEHSSVSAAGLHQASPMGQETPLTLQTDRISQHHLGRPCHQRPQQQQPDKQPVHPVSSSSQSSILPVTGPGGQCLQTGRVAGAVSVASPSPEVLVAGFKSAPAALLLSTTTATTSSLSSTLQPDTLHPPSEARPDSSDEEFLFRKDKPHVSPGQKGSGRKESRVDVSVSGCGDDHIRGVEEVKDESLVIVHPDIILNSRMPQASHESSCRGVGGGVGGGSLFFSRCLRLLAMVSCLMGLAGYAQGVPAPSVEKRYRQLHANTLKYLAQFGYLNGPSRETQNLMSQEDLTRAIKALQRAGGIPQTGVPDSRTEALMARPRCGNLDDFVEDARGYQPKAGSDGIARSRKRRYTVATSKWPRTNLTFRFINYTPDMPQAQTRQLIGDAFRVWSDATPLSFTEVRHSEADVMIQFASNYHSDGYPFDGRGMVLAHAFFPGHRKGGDTHFDDDELWTTNSSEGVDLFMVAAHEFGHALGLAHSGDPSALMYPWYMGFEGKFKLPEDDYRGITSLYGSGERDRHLPDRAKVNLIPHSNDPDQEVPYDIDPTKATQEEEDGPADPCYSHVDALTVLRTEIFLFIGQWFWRLDSRKIINKPVKIHQFWYGLPKHLEKIDAVFERPDNKIVFFSGDRYWVFNANHLIGGFPNEGRPITEFNIPADVKSIDAAFVWGYNQRTYLVSGDMYWKMNENNTFVEYDYPRDMGTWKGVPVPLDAAFKDWSGKTYFFQGQDYWEFYDMRMKVRRGYPKRISQHWLKCAEVYEQREQSQDISNQDDSTNTKLAGKNHPLNSGNTQGNAGKVNQGDGGNGCGASQLTLIMMVALLGLHWL